ncbi:MAG: class I SAM-dependent methyltransferase [Candidatus Binataceae bacterium]
MSETDIDRVNQAAYSSKSALKLYDRSDIGLSEAEGRILNELLPEIKNKKLLDIGFGGGRTTSFLLDISRDYTGIDYSALLAERAKARFGIETLYHCDARDLSRFGDNTFDFALFSFNGLDSISHADRLLALAEIYRVLKPGGIFLFSGHNRKCRYIGAPPWRGRRWQWTFAFLKGCAWAVLLQPRHWRMRPLEVHEKEYAILNDSGLRYQCLLYYISIPAQLKQLGEIGFERTRIYDMHGCPAREDDTDSVFIHYLARKPLR